MRGRGIGAIAAAAALALGVGACGGSDDSGKTEEEASAAAVEIISSNDPENCQRLSDSLLEAQYGSAGDERVAACEQQIVATPAPKDVKVTDMTLDGDSATGSMTSDLASADFTMVYTDGEWKLDSLDNVTVVNPEDFVAPESGGSGGNDKSGG